MNENIRTLLLSKIHEDNMLGLCVLKATCVDWFQFFLRLNTYIGHSSIYFRYESRDNYIPHFRYDHIIADIPFKEE